MGTIDQLDLSDLLRRLTALGIVREIPGMSEDPMAPPMTLNLDDLSLEEQKEILDFLKKLVPMKLPLSLAKELLPSLVKELGLKNLSFSEIITALSLKLTRPYEEIFDLLNFNRAEVFRLQGLWSLKNPDEAALKDGALALKKLAKSLHLDEGDIRAIIRNSLPPFCGDKDATTDRIMAYVTKP